MTETNAFGRRELIETAMNRASDGANPNVKPPTDPNAIWREQQAQAMKARQAQLEAARSDDERENMTRLVKPVLLEPTSRFPSGRSVLLAVVGLMVLGAAVWWGSNRSKSQGAEPVRQTVVTLPAPLAQAPVEAAEVAVVVPSPPTVEDREEQARNLVEVWRQAWAQRDVDAYLASYGPSFTPPKGQNRAQWEAARRDNLSSRGSIDVATKELRTEPLGEQQMAVHFLQDYTSPTYQEKAVPKTLLLQQVDGQWQIVGEWSGAFQKISPPAK